jgi:hypothetical protein
MSTLEREAERLSAALATGRAAAGALKAPAVPAVLRRITAACAYGGFRGLRGDARFRECLHVWRHPWSSNPSPRHRSYRRKSFFIYCLPSLIPRALQVSWRPV